jgi:hypothetical protein
MAFLDVSPTIVPANDWSVMSEPNSSTPLLGMTIEPDPLMSPLIVAVVLTMREPLSMIVPESAFDPV